MKILFLYTKFDSALKERIRLLKAHNAEVSALSLLEYKLIEDAQTTQLEPVSKLEFLEKYSPKLRVLNRIFKRKSLLSSLDDYDIIDLYKCEKSALFIVDEIREKCYDFFVTISPEESKPNLLITQFYQYLYNKARFLIFNTSASKENFAYQHEEKSRLIYDGVPLLDAIDQISQEAIFKASHTMGLDLDKDIIYCDMSGTLETQMCLIDDLMTLPIHRLRQSTFIFHLNAHTLEERKALKAHLAGKNFDYLLIEALLTAKQIALLFSIADTSLILSNSPALIVSLYSKNLTYLYGDIMIDARMTREKLFIENFEAFKEQHEQNSAITDDLLEKNREKIAAYFTPDASINSYIEVIREV